MFHMLVKVVVVSMQIKQFYNPSQKLLRLTNACLQELVFCLLPPQNNVEACSKHCTPQFQTRSQATLLCGGGGEKSNFHIGSLILFVKDCLKFKKKTGKGSLLGLLHLLTLYCLEYFA